jgi:oxygen-dependent protoporphyrinogen oxidase
MVAVVGGGVSGLAAAWELTGGAHPARDAPGVTVFEASSRFGGPLRSETFGGRIVDVGPDGFLGRRPEAVTLCREVGLGEALEPIAARGASVWSRQRLRPFPRAHVLGVPVRFWATVRTGALGPAGVLALARDAVLPRPDVRGPMGDRAVGPLVARKLGHQVVDTLVDPLLGGIYAGTVEEMSAAATVPPLLAAAQRRGSLARALRAEMPAPDDSGTPLFWSLREGMGSLVERLVAALRDRGVDLRVATPVRSLERVGGRWRLRAGDDAAAAADATLDADGVVLATPAPTTGALLRPHDDDAAGLLEAIDYASATVATFRVEDAALSGALEGTGFVVPRRAGHKGHDPWAVTACTFLDRKWPHLARPGEVLLRASLGRIDDRRPDEWTDDQVAERAWDEVSAFLGLAGAPSAAMVARHPHGLPQYRVHHLLRTAGVEGAVARLGGVTVAGSAYRGVGIPACVASGRTAAHALL